MFSVPLTYLKSRFNCLNSNAVGLFNFVHNNRTVLWMSVLSLLRYNRVSTEDQNLDVCSSLNSSLSPSMHAFSNFGETLPLQSLISNFFNADWKCYLFGMLVSFFPSHTFTVFKYSKLPHQIPCTYFISIFSERNVNNSATIVSFPHPCPSST